MALNSSAVGRSYPPTAPYVVSGEKLREFATAIGVTDRVCLDGDVARAHGFADVVAAPTFPFVLAWQALAGMIEDPDLEIDFSRLVHGDQRFALSRPLVAGDAVTGAATVESVKQVGGNAMITGRVDFTGSDGSPLGSAWSMLVIRAPEPTEQRPAEHRPAEQSR